MQGEFEERGNRLNANKKACNASAILCGNQLVQEHYIGSFYNRRGRETNRCQDCNALRFPGERYALYCQKGKVTLNKIPEPTPLLKSLLNGDNVRSIIFKKHIVAINNALAMASLKVKHKSVTHGNFQPHIIILSRV